jgi:hypothetical protein
METILGGGDFARLSNDKKMEQVRPGGFSETVFPPIEGRWRDREAGRRT